MNFSPLLPDSIDIFFVGKMITEELMPVLVTLIAIAIMFFKVLIIFFAGLYSGIYLADRYGGLSGILAYATDRNMNTNSGTGDGNSSRAITTILSANRDDGINVVRDRSRSAITMTSGGIRIGTTPAIVRVGNFGRFRCGAGNDPAVVELETNSVRYSCSCVDTEVSKEEVPLSPHGWCIKPSKMANSTRNYVRETLVALKGLGNPEKSAITLSLDDPCVYGNFSCPNELKSAMLDAVTSIKYNGYAPSQGLPEVREAVAEYMSQDGVKYIADDIIMYVGCAGALENCISVLAGEEEGSNILIPRPGYPLYRTIAEDIGIKCKFYNLMADRNWEVDLKNLESQIDSNTAVIIVNNPSNPCGSVYNKEHLEAILNVANRHKIPIIADEIHHRIVFSGKKFVSMAAVRSDVPRLICSGIGKSFLVPGWRIGWVAIHDPAGHFEKEIRKALNSFCSRIVGTCVINQGAIINGLSKVPQTYFDDICNTLNQNAKVCYELLSKIRGLKPIMPEGAFCMMVEIKKNHFPDLSSSMDFVKRLLEEQTVFCLPGECFEMPYFMRIAITPPEKSLEEAIKRISTFCCKYFK